MCVQHGFARARAHAHTHAHTRTHIHLQSHTQHTHTHTNAQAECTGKQHQWHAAPVPTLKHTDTSTTACHPAAPTSHGRPGAPPMPEAHQPMQGPSMGGIPHAELGDPFVEANG